MRDVGRAEDLAQDAFVAALSQWPQEGIPRNPGAWLTTAAKRRAIDSIRRDKTLERKADELGRDMETQEAGSEYETVFEEINDDMLRLMFAACHPVLSTQARVALTLRLIGGLSTTEIARAFLTSEATIAQRIVRAKRTLTEARVPLEVPAGPERAERLEAVLEAIYLIFNEGYAASAGDDVLRPELVEDALRVGRVLAELVPDESEVHGLVALMELQASRMRARVAPSGEPILLLDQDRGKWNRLLIGRGLDALARARKLRAALGPYALQAAIAACHARAAMPDQTDWHGIAALYDALAEIAPSPVIELKSRGGGRHGIRPCRGTRNRGCPARGARAQVVSPAAQRARRFAAEARPLARGRRGVRTRGGARTKRSRQEFTAAARRSVSILTNAVRRPNEKEGPP